MKKKMAAVLVLLIVLFIVFNVGVAVGQWPEPDYHCRANTTCYFTMEYESTVIIECISRNKRLMFGVIKINKGEVFCNGLPR